MQTESVRLRAKILEANPSELSQVADFVGNKYRQLFGTSPQIAPEELCFVAKQHGRIVGTISVEFAEGANQFRLEKIYNFDLGKNRDSFTVFGKFIAEIPGLGPALAYTAVSYAIGRRKKFALCCSKPQFLGMLQKKYGLKFAVIASEINSGEINPWDAEFFGTTPKPRLYSWHLAGWHDILKEKIPPWAEICL